MWRVSSAPCRRPATDAAKGPYAEASVSVPYTLNWCASLSSLAASRVSEATLSPTCALPWLTWEDYWLMPAILRVMPSTIVAASATLLLTWEMPCEACRAIRNKKSYDNFWIKHLLHRL